MHKLRCQFQICKNVRLHQSLNNSYIKSDRFLATSVKIENSFCDKFENNLVSNNSNYEKCHKPDGWISLHEFKKRRKNLASAIVKFHQKSIDISQKANATNHLIVVAAAQRSFMVGKVPYFYRQATDLRYLTGHLLPDSALVIEIEHEEKDAKSLQSKSTIFVQDSNMREEIWEGKRISPEEAKEHYGVDAAYHTSNLRQYLDTYVKDKQTNSVNSRNATIWYDFNSPEDRNIHGLMNNLKAHVNGNLKDWHFMSPKYCIDENRLIKSEEEIQLMRQTCQVASNSICKTISQTHSLDSELQMAATVEYFCKMHGASHMAYPSVVASGDNANIIHYDHSSNDKFDENSRKCNLLLMDAGCELGGYTSDVTRTWPLSGQFNKLPQRLVYEAVLDVQKTLITALRQNNCSDRGNKIWTVDNLYYEMKKLFLPHFIDLGLIEEKDEEQLANVAISEACPHHVSHYLGMDVHDTPTVSKSRPLLPGMVITIEPALYFPRYRNLRHVKLREELKGIGVRIEDDILITENDVIDEEGKSDKQLSCEVLSSKCPKSIGELEVILSRDFNC